jgi:putative SOS response-associated peptidase YedK
MAMPVILTEGGCDTWLEADTAAALKLHRPFPAERLAVEESPHGLLKTAR